VVDVNGSQATSAVTVEFVGNLKLGQFRLSYNAQGELQSVTDRKGRLPNLPTPPLPRCQRQRTVRRRNRLIASSSVAALQAPAAN
jgi:hypothetical protein